LELPLALRPGDRVAVFAASSPFNPALALRGLGWLAERYRVVFDRWFGW
jgi:muramoyltetrapeptide carboxypeptidase